MATHEGTVSGAPPLSKRTGVLNSFDVWKLFPQAQGAEKSIGKGWPTFTGRAVYHWRVVV
jgi:hypothetical protein